MLEKLIAFKNHVCEAAGNPAFVHHAWFVQWHLNIVDKIAGELLAHYPSADRSLVEAMVWLHDYGKIIDLEHQYETTLTAGRQKLTELGFPTDFVEKAVSYIEMLDKKMELDLTQAPVEVQIVSSADGLSHLIGPFMHLWWQENAGQPYQQLMADNKAKALKDWTRKIVLPEARAAAEGRYNYLLEQMGNIPAKIIQ